MPVKVDALDHLVINVSDVARSAQWYAKILGMEIRVFDPGEGKKQAHLAGVRQPEDQCPAEGRRQG